ncbi:speckle targeted PIP5K1A-regulated poly(A) polymerase-like isoform X1 [Ischnura elegans]|uniref:speckle targeted PIP5K1A-regulated poly(A) polymerase-like isoform X1 n=1 Tax=Ischnura elegans TaxID=197161 RepID=UPI001ED872DE|nr:speckle targeted PIP5K1A-regulated poly(A) polymerase-like isoform X1 [Ischnura elegans]XP_046384522.1 speckle targeted PIP5K1A-regulated poly(A) polymerase-like isoform X1 [Ischnura elegans]
MSGKGIFVKGFNKSVTYLEVEKFFRSFGPLEEITFNKRQLFAIVEFRERTSAERVLSREIYFKGKKLIVSVRWPKSPSANNRKAAQTQPDNRATNAAEVGRTGSLSEKLSWTNFESQIMQFTKETEAIDLARKVEMIKASLRRALIPSFPACKILPFGSSVTGLASRESDVDIYVDIGHRELNHIERSPRDLVMETKGILLKNHEFFKCIPIPKARVPILKCCHKSTQLNCDINFQNALGVFNSHLIKFYLSLDPHLKDIIMFVKYWAKKYHLCGPGSFTSYALVMLFLFYIQQSPQSTIPPVEVLQRNCNFQNIVQDWDCQFDADPRRYKMSENKTPYLTILRDFFKFYYNFEFENNVIIMNYGISVPRDSFQTPPEDSVVFRYKLALQQRNAEPIELDRVACVLDPFVLNHNITASIDLRVLNRFQIRCFKSAEVCEEIQNGACGLTLRAIGGSPPQVKKTKFPYLELWTKNCVKMTIPLRGFNAKHSFFVNDECEVKDSSKFGLMEELISHVKKIFERVLRLSVIKEEVKKIPENPERRQIAKMEGMADIHGHGNSILQELKIHMSGCFHVWNGRAPAYKEFAFPSDMSNLEKEMHVTNYIVDTFYQGAPCEPHRTDINCTLVPIMDYQCLQVEISPCEPSETFNPLTLFLLNLLNKWLRE